MYVFDELLSLFTFIIIIIAMGRSYFLPSFTQFLPQYTRFTSALGDDDDDDDDEMTLWNVRRATQTGNA